MSYHNDYPYICREHGPLTDENTDLKLSKYIDYSGRPELVRCCKVCDREVTPNKAFK